MPRLDSERRARLDAILRAQEQLVTAAQLRALGMESSSTAHRLNVTEAWRRLLPGIYLAHRGQPTVSQRRRAALLYTGTDAILSGHAALSVVGSRVVTRRDHGLLLTLVPHHRQRKSAGFVVVERTIRPPVALDRGGLVIAPPARAAIDATRRMDDFDDVRALLADVVQSGLTTVDLLGLELDAAQRRGTRLPRRALSALRAGTRSAPEAILRDLWIASGLPEPLWNPTLTTLSGEFIARPDAYLPEVGIAVEVDSKEFHLAPGDWERTMERHGRMTSHDVAVLHVPPSRLARDGVGFMAGVAATVVAREGRPPPDLRVTPLR